MKRTLLSIWCLLLSIPGYSTGDLNFGGGCIDNVTHTITVAIDLAIPGATLYLYIPGVNYDPTSYTPYGYGIPSTSVTTDPFNPTSQDFTFDISAYPLSSYPMFNGCVTFTYSDASTNNTIFTNDPSYPYAGDSKFYSATVCPCTEPIPTACYFTDNNGNITIKLMSTLPNINNYFLWGPDNSGYIYAASNTGTLDPDGVHYDYFFPNYPLNIKDGCGTIYYSTYAYGNGDVNDPNQYDPREGTWASSLQTCACPVTPVAQCYSENNNGYLTIKLSYPVSTTVFLWSNTGAGATAYTSSTPVLDYSGNYDYTYTIPITDIPGYASGQGQCYTFYVNTQSTTTTSDHPDPVDFATAIRICPCCSQSTQSYISYSLSTESTNPLSVTFPTAVPSTFNFGDGSPQPFGTNELHTYGAANSYTVTETSSPSFGVPPCTKSDIICLTGDAITNDAITSVVDGNGDNHYVYCNANFTVTINGDWALVTPSPITTTHLFGLNFYSTAITGINWGDGTSSSISSPNHTYATGNWTICSEAPNTWAFPSASCQTCLTICIDDADHNAQRHAANTPTVQQLINDITLSPNPATDVTTLTFNLQSATTIMVDVVDVIGRVVVPVSKIPMQAGNQKVVINTDHLPSGIYNVNIQTDKGTTTKRLSVVK